MPSPTGLLAVHRPDHLEPVLLLRAGGGAALPADGRDPAARRPLRPALQDAEHLAEPHAGGLLHTNIAASGVFSAISGSSVATAATMGSVALPFFQGKPYDPKMVLGSLAAGGALGNLIPPGITFIIYGLITETSVGALYVAAIGPSILVVALFIAIILFKAKTGARAIPTGRAIPGARSSAASSISPPPPSSSSSSSARSMAASPRRRNRRRSASSRPSSSPPSTASSPSRC